MKNKLSAFSGMIYSMTREDFLLRDKRREELFQKTKEEIEQEKNEWISRKEKIVSPIMEAKNIVVDPKRVDTNYRYGILIEYFYSNRQKYKELLGDKISQAHLEEKALEYASKENKYQTFLDLVIRLDGSILDLLQ